MVVRIKGASPADEVSHLSAPVHLSRDLDCHIDADLFELLGCRLSDIHTNLVSRADADDKAQFFAVSVVETVVSHRTPYVLKDFFGFLRIVIVVLHIFIVVNVPLQGAVSRHSLA